MAILYLIANLPKLNTPNLFHLSVDLTFIILPIHITSTQELDELKNFKIIDMLFRQFKLKNFNSFFCSKYTYHSIRELEKKKKKVFLPTAHDNHVKCVHYGKDIS